MSLVALPLYLHIWWDTSFRFDRLISLWKDPYIWVRVKVPERWCVETSALGRVHHCNLYTAPSAEVIVGKDFTVLSGQECACLQCFWGLLGFSSTVIYGVPLISLSPIIEIISSKSLLGPPFSPTQEFVTVVFPFGARSRLLAHSQWWYHVSDSWTPTEQWFGHSLHVGPQIHGFGQQLHWSSKCSFTHSRAGNGVRVLDTCRTSVEDNQRIGMLKVIITPCQMCPLC